MPKIYLLVVSFTLFIFLGSCFHGVTYYYRPTKDTTQIKYHYTQTGQLSNDIRESSGLISVQDSFLVTHGDSGNLPYLYVTTLQGQLVKKIYIKEIHNLDWEAITRDKTHLYLADIGNNMMERQQFSIYRIPLDLSKDTLEPDKKIVYVYPNQKVYPKHRNHDAEAIFYAEPYLYVFTKNYGIKSTDVYRINPDKDSVQAATWIARSYLDSYVTDVAYNTQKQEISILTYGFVYVYHTKLDSSLFEQAQLTARLRLPLSQTEAITYLNDTTLLITNEKGNLFTLSLLRKHRNKRLSRCCVGIGLF